LREWHRSSAKARTIFTWGLVRAKLDALRDLVGGRGCVVRHGYLAYSWGDVAQSGDIASAVKPIISTLLLLAVQEGKLRTANDPVADFEPRLPDAIQTQPVLARPSLDLVVREALTRRSELVQAQLFAEAVCLETDAQAAGRFKLRMETFAAGTDIHANLVPAETHNGEYRPGAVPPEMPTLFAGTASERALHAGSLVKRAEMVVQAARNLIALEAEDAFLRWQEAFEQTRKAKLAADEGDALARDLDKDFTSGLNVRIDEVVTAQVLSSQARSGYLDFLYKQILALADLERVTVGGFNAELAGKPSGFVPAPDSGLQGPAQSPKAGSGSATSSPSPAGKQPPFHP
jgi:hypothetical protein